MHLNTPTDLLLSRDSLDSSVSIIVPRIMEIGIILNPSEMIMVSILVRSQLHKGRDGDPDNLKKNPYLGKRIKGKQK